MAGYGVFACSWQRNMILTQATVRAEAVVAGGAPVAPPARDVLLAGALARVLVAQAGLRPRVVALAGLAEPALEGVHRDGLEDVLADLRDVLGLLAGDEELSAVVVLVLGLEGQSGLLAVEDLEAVGLRDQGNLGGEGQLSNVKHVCCCCCG